MSRRTSKEIRLSQAKELLSEIGLPPAQCNDRSAWVFLALAGIKPNNSNWSGVAANLMTTRDIMDFIRDNYAKDYKPNSRETIRRQSLHQFEQAHLVRRNVDDPTRATNSGNNNYSLSPAAIQILDQFPKGEWRQAIKAFQEETPTLAKRYARELSKTKIPVKLPDGARILLSPGAHNQLHAEVVNHFIPRFAQGGKFLYIGDTASSRGEGGKLLHHDSSGFAEIGLPNLGHDKLPDIVYHDTLRNWLFLIEAVTSHGPISEKRFIELTDQFKDGAPGLVFVTAFADQKTFRRFASGIAWETEVWIAERPDHLIHFNGDRFLGPR